MNNDLVIIAKAVKVGVGKIWIGIVNEKLIFNGEAVTVKIAPERIVMIKAAEGVKSKG